jgi:hypothetical protein
LLRTHSREVFIGLQQIITAALDYPFVTSSEVETSLDVFLVIAIV